jgi:signal transduction histidine kinase
LGVPVFDGNRIVVIAAVANKEEEYDESDVRQLTLLTDGMWQLINSKQAEAEAIRSSHLASLGELAAGVAHEINNPINGIINCAQIIVDKMDKDSSEYEFAERIIKEGDRIEVIVRSLLSFARDREQEKSPVHLQQIMSDTMTLTGAQLRKDSITLNVNISADTPVIMANPQQVEQVLLNLINNARYALNQKYPNADKNKIIEISSRKISVNNHSFVQIMIHDNGAGIPVKIQSKVIDPFFSSKPADKGTGLGLSISHGIVSNHNGKLTIESVENEFTKVIIDLPCQE